MCLFIYGEQGGQQGVLDPPELELQEAMSSDAGAGN